MTSRNLPDEALTERPVHVPEVELTLQGHGSEYTHAGAGHDTSPFPRLVLGCIDADRNEKWRIFQHFSKSTRIYTFFVNIFLNNQNLVILLKFSENSGDFCENSKIFSKIFIIFWKKCENRVDLEKR